VAAQRRLFGILPFAVFYVAPYTLGMVPNQYLKLSVLSLALIPLTLAWAIVRYRLMDVDILFRRGYAYTLATLCVLAAFYAIVFTLASLVQKNFKDLGDAGLVTVMLIAAFLFQPIRNWIQERLDKHFYRDRYDYRRTLVEFARELSSETDLDDMLASVGERLIQTLSIRHLAFFLAERPDGRGAAAHSPCGRPWVVPAHDSGRGAGSGASSASSRAPYLFFERTPADRRGFARMAGHGPPHHRRPGSDLLRPVHGPRTHHRFLGVSRTEDGDFLSRWTWNCCRRCPATWPSRRERHAFTARCSAR
jgi:two-component system, NtrC family, sensor kinase